MTYLCIVKAFFILFSFRLSFIWLKSISKLKTKNNRLKQTSIQNALCIVVVSVGLWNFKFGGFCETLQNYSSFRQTFRWHISMGNNSCPNDLKFCEVSRNNKTKRCLCKISEFYLDKQKSFIPKKTLSVPCTMDSSTNG